MGTLGRLIGSTLLTPAVAPWLLLLATAALGFRLTWKWGIVRYRQQAGNLAAGLFLFSPATVYAAAQPGFKWGPWMVPFLLLLFFTSMQAMENWSTFMRSIVLAMLWSLFLRIDSLNALLVLIAMVPWILCTRRPLLALGTFLTILILGTAIFSVMDFLNCMFSHHSAVLDGSMLCAQNVYQFIRAIRPAIGGQGWTYRLVSSRCLLFAGVISPYWVLLGFWIVGRVIGGMIRDRRANVVELETVVSIVLLLALCFRPEANLLTVVRWLPVLSLWVPLLGRELSRQDKFSSKAYRQSALAGFLVSLPIVWVLWKTACPLTSAIGVAVQFALCAAFGGLILAARQTGSLSRSQRLQSFLVGSACGYSLMVDGLLCRGVNLF